MFFYFVVNREASLGIHTRSNTTFMMGILGDGNRDDLNKSARHKNAESHNSHEQCNSALIALLKTVSINQDEIALVPA